MSTTFWIILVVVLGICIYVFTKTISNDAENDYRLRDILANSNNDDMLSDERPNTKINLNLKESEIQPEPEKNIYEEIAQEQQKDITKNTYNEYSTQTHEVPNNVETKKVAYDYPKTDYYEKINDDVCEYDENIEEDKNEKNEFYPKRRSIFDYVKTFWRSITFTIGVVICLCALYCLTAQIANSNDAVVYSVWLLIGLILIK